MSLTVKGAGMMVSLKQTNLGVVRPFLTPKGDHFVDKDILVQCSLGIDVKENFD